MADAKVSELPAASLVAAANEFPINEAGTSKKVTAQQIKTYVDDFSIIRCNATRTLPNDTNLNPIFNSPANGRLTLPTGTYLFDALLIITAMSATSGNALLNILGAGTAVIDGWMWRLSGLDNTSPNSIADDDAAYFVVGVSAASAVAAGTGTALRLSIEGTFEVTTGGTIIPSIDLVTAAAAIVSVGSYFAVKRIGPVDLVSVGAWD